MIDEKRLDEIEKHSNELSGYFQTPMLSGHVKIRHDTIKELIRLARLGLWAEKEAIPAMSKSSNDSWYINAYTKEECSSKRQHILWDHVELSRKLLHQALAALPKDTLREEKRG